MKTRSLLCYSRGTQVRKTKMVMEKMESLWQNWLTSPAVLAFSLQEEQLRAAAEGFCHRRHQHELLKHFMILDHSWLVMGMIFNHYDTHSMNKQSRKSSEIKVRKVTAPLWVCTEKTVDFQYIKLKWNKKQFELCLLNYTANSYHRIKKSIVARQLNSFPWFHTTTVW